MTFKEIWDSLCCKEPLLKDDNSAVEFKAGNLRRLLEQVYDQGANSASIKNDPIFGDLFRKFM